LLPLLLVLLQLGLVAGGEVLGDPLIVLVEILPVLADVAMIVGQRLAVVMQVVPVMLDVVDVVMDGVFRGRGAAGLVLGLGQSRERKQAHGHYNRYQRLDHHLSPGEKRREMRSLSQEA
jgi:hypothetical protein